MFYVQVTTTPILTPPVSGSSRRKAVFQALLSTTKISGLFPGQLESIPIPPTLEIDSGYGPDKVLPTPTSARDQTTVAGVPFRVPNISHRKTSPNLLVPNPIPLGDLPSLTQKSMRIPLSASSLPDFLTPQHWPLEQSLPYDCPIIRFSLQSW